MTALSSSPRSRRPAIRLGFTLAAVAAAATLAAPAIADPTPASAGTEITARPGGHHGNDHGNRNGHHHNRTPFSLLRTGSA